METMLSERRLFIVSLKRIIWRLNSLNMLKQAYISTKLTILCVKSVPLQGAVFVTDYSSQFTLIGALKIIHFRHPESDGSSSELRPSGLQSANELRNSCRLQRSGCRDHHWQQRWIHSLQHSTDQPQCQFFIPLNHQKHNLGSFFNFICSSWRSCSWFLAGDPVESKQGSLSLRR